MKKNHYKCNICGKQFPHWMVDNDVWMKVGIELGFVPKAKICKPCFEKPFGKPHYHTLHEYISNCAISFHCNYEDAYDVIYPEMKNILENDIDNTL